jgi:hypothetical protein
MTANTFVAFESELDIAVILMGIHISQLFEDVLFSAAESFELDPKRTGQGFPRFPFVN